MEVLRVDGLGEVLEGQDLAALLVGAADLRDGDVLVVAQKIVSKSEGAFLDLRPGEAPAEGRRRLARERAARVVVDADRVLVVATRRGFVCANAGIDASNVPGGRLVDLPADPDASARRLRDGIRALAGVEVGVVVADTFGRAWRRGQTDVAIGLAGLPAVRDERGTMDRQGNLLEVTETAIADALAAAADLVRHKADGVPAVVVRGSGLVDGADAGAAVLVRPLAEDLFPHGRGWLAAALAGAVAPERAGPPSAEDMSRAVDAARLAAQGVEITVIGPDEVTVRAADPVAAGFAGGLLVAALLDLGYRARWTGDRVLAHEGHGGSDNDR